jgi:hypothetical protein
MTGRAGRSKPALGTDQSGSDVNIGFDELVAGIRYRVTINDCCAEGHFVGTFVGYDLNREPEDDDVEGEHDTAHFDTGVIGPSWGQLTFTVLP